MSRNPEILVLSGAAIAPYLDDLAQLRISVFRDWPYLYDGDAGYEAQYLQTYLESPRSVVVLAVDGERVVGASTGLPMSDEADAFRLPLQRAGIDVARVFYCGESVLLPAYRGRGLGHRFFDEREAHARRLGGVDCTAFCAVDRIASDPRRPDAHRDNDTFWLNRGYKPRTDLQARLPWREIGRGEVEHTLTFWMRPLQPHLPESHT